MNGLSRLALLLVIPASAVGCNKREPRLPGPVAQMTMPAPPARLLIPVDLPEPPAPEPEAPTEPTPAPAPIRRDPVAATRPTDKPVTLPPAEVAPPPVLRTTTDTVAMERKIQQLLGAAQQSLGLVNYRDLSANARAQYDQAKTFIRLASDALKARNYNFAETTANRAAALAGLLVKG